MNLFGPRFWKLWGYEYLTTKWRQGLFILMSLWLYSKSNPGHFTQVHISKFKKKDLLEIGDFDKLLGSDFAAIGQKDI